MDPQNAPADETAIERQLWGLWAASTGLQYVENGDLPLDRTFTDMLPLSIMIRHVIVPVGRRENTLRVAGSRAGDVFAEAEVRAVCGLQIEWVLARPSAIKKALRRLSSGLP